jgi:hypothetical protein
MKSRSGAQRFQCCCPGNKLLKEGVQCFLGCGAGLEDGEVFEVRGKGQRDLGPYVANLQFTSGAVTDRLPGWTSTVTVELGAAVAGRAIEPTRAADTAAIGIHGR